MLLLAAGAGERLTEGTPKALVPLGGVPIVRRAADAAAAADLVDRLVVAAPEGREDEVRRALDGLAKPVSVVSGGSTRQASAAAAFAEAVGAEAVVVHDAARPLCPHELFDQCLRELDTVEAACVCVPVTDTVKEVDGDVIRATLDRRRLAAAQTPQAFRSDVYRRAHALATEDATDDASLVERMGVPVRVVPGDPMNIKITTPTDLRLAESIVSGR